MKSLRDGRIYSAVSRTGTPRAEYAGILRDISDKLGQSTKCPCCGFDGERSDAPSWHKDLRMIRRRGVSVKLSRRETAVFEFLWQWMMKHRSPANSTTIAAAIYANDPDGGPLNHTSLISQYVKRLNARIAPLSMAVRGTRTGYQVKVL